MPISIPGLDIEVSFQYHSDMCDIVIINERKQIRKRKRAPLAITYPSFRLFSDKHYVFLKNFTICQLDAVSETLTFSIDNKINQYSKMTQIVLRFNTFSTKIVHHVCSMNSFFMGESAVQKRNCSTFASSNTRTIFLLPTKHCVYFFYGFLPHKVYVLWFNSILGLNSIFFCFWVW